MKNDILYFMGGPTLSIGHDSRLQPFVRFLAGGALTRFNVKAEVPVFIGNLTGSFNTNTTNFAAAAGGGLDWRVGDRVKLRLFQIDYAPVFLSDRSISTLISAGALAPFSLGSQRMDNLRFAFGIVF